MIKHEMTLAAQPGTRRDAIGWRGRRVCYNAAAHATAALAG